MYTATQKKFRKDNLSLWEERLKKIFNDSIPEHYEWGKVEEINDMINRIAGRSLNHMLYPDSGGLDIVGCKSSLCNKQNIEILTDGSAPNICKPKKLVFESINGDAEWSYFRLELYNMEPSGIYLEKDSIVEEVYEYNNIFEMYSDYPPNENYRHVLRLLRGTLLIIPKTCYYNHLPQTYLGIHNKYSHIEFRSLMERLKESKDYVVFLTAFEK